MTTTAHRQQALRERRLSAGLVRTQVWVPAQWAERVKTYARRLAAMKGTT